MAQGFLHLQKAATAHTRTTIGSNAWATGSAFRKKAAAQEDAGELQQQRPHLLSLLTLRKDKVMALSPLA